MANKFTVAPMESNMSIPLPYEPKRTNRWIVTFPEDFEIPDWTMTKACRPKFLIHNKMVSYGEMTFTFRDPIGPSMSQAVWDLLLKITTLSKSYDPNSDVETTEFWKKYRTGFPLKIEMLDPTGHVVESWDLAGCKLLSVDFGELDYSDDSFATLSMKIKPDLATLQF